MNQHRIEQEIVKTTEKIEGLQERLKKLEALKRENEDTEFVKLIRKNGISAEELEILIAIGKQENKMILENRDKEKEQVCNERQME